MNRLWERHDREWRDPAQIASQWRDASAVDPRIMRHRVRGSFWEILADNDVLLVVTREYEHLIMALGVEKGRPHVTFAPLPHPSGVAVDRRRGIVHIASTRNPNQIYDFVPVTGLADRLDVDMRSVPDRPLVPVRSRFFPGALYLHDMAIVGGQLHANAVGENAVISIEEDGQYRRVWWPRCIETPDGPVFGRNYLQLNSIAAGRDLRSSFYSASADRISFRRPGHRNFPVDRRGVVFSGATREPVVRGLTRPHSARLHRGQVWVDDSGYGGVGVVIGDVYEPVAHLPGWTRGLCFHKGLAFVGTSRVIPRFRQYAPGLDLDNSVAGVHAVDTASGRVLGSLVWPLGNQIFSIDLVPARLASGFAFIPGTLGSKSRRELFYAFTTYRRPTRGGQG